MIWTFLPILVAVPLRAQASMPLNHLCLFLGLWVPGPVFHPSSGSHPSMFIARLCSLPLLGYRPLVLPLLGYDFAPLGLWVPGPWSCPFQAMILPFLEYGYLVPILPYSGSVLKSLFLSRLLAEAYFLCRGSAPGRTPHNCHVPLWHSWGPPAPHPPFSTNPKLWATTPTQT